MNPVNWTFDYFHDYSRPKICDMRHVQHWTWSNWFGYYQYIMVPIVETCFLNLNQDAACWATPQLDKDMSPNCPGAYNMISCVQTYLPQQIALAMAGAQVILGLAPALISSLSPSVGEISMLSANRPLLSLLLVMASPALWSPRFLEYDDPLEVLKPQKNTPFDQRRRYVVGKREKWISAGQYTIAILAMFATFGISWQLGYYSVSSWKVGCPELIFIWSCLVLIPHLVASVSWYYSYTMAAERVANRFERQEENDRFGWFKASFMRETTICAAKRRRSYLKHRSGRRGGSSDSQLPMGVSYVGDQTANSSDSLEHLKKEHWWVLWSNIVAGWMGWVQVVYGTCVFSSLLFIGPLNAFACIMSYVGATLVCRGVMTYELQGMRAVEFQGILEDEVEVDGRPGFRRIETGMYDRDDLRKANATLRMTVSETTAVDG
ncbi:MAG: hypothetical protein GOMPHAMPRED_005250 [Gomphillus americanus]|uniref:Uncharacterized protein n=1 Tax=Gomphillus americanus TaxID=1940652 RepID=A0A8H3FTP2_9LECA|nr:MAG: hypothetical protein GOMPHAMPRED_005250 [Gomphillus americanus]